MNTFLRATKCALLSISALLLAQNVLAFPPAPHHTFFGLVRDEYGNPIDVTSAEVVLETASGVQVKTTIFPHLDSGVNYRLAVPMDAGLADDLYKFTALRPAAPFKIKVRIGNTVYLPLEMVADYSHLGEPGRSTLLNLTLGEDTDGDGIPDAWERALMQVTGMNKPLSEIRPGDDADGDGLSNLDEYLAGTYPFDPTNGLTLAAKHVSNGIPQLEFTAVQGRTYLIQGSMDLKTWQSVNFRVVGGTAGAENQSYYQATPLSVILVEILAQTGQQMPRFFRLLLH